MSEPLVVGDDAPRFDDGLILIVDHPKVATVAYCLKELTVLDPSLNLLLLPSVTELRPLKGDLATTGNDCVGDLREAAENNIELLRLL